MGYPMVDEDTLRINSPFGFLTSTADKALKTYMTMKEGHRKAETDIAKSILEGLIKRDDMQMRSDLPEGFNPQNVSDIRGMFEPVEKKLTPKEQIDIATYNQEYGGNAPVNFTPDQERFPAAPVSSYGKEPITQRVPGLKEKAQNIDMFKTKLADLTQKRQEAHDAEIVRHNQEMERIQTKNAKKENEVKTSQILQYQKTAKTYAEEEAKQALTLFGGGKIFSVNKNTGKPYTQQERNQFVTNRSQEIFNDLLTGNPYQAPGGMSNSDKIPKLQNKLLSRNNYTPIEEKTIQDNMDAYGKSREEVVFALQKKGVLK